jgi:PAS domain S-box-containing protein
LGNEYPDPLYRPLKRKPGYKQAIAKYAPLNSMPLPVIRQIKKAKVIPVHNNYLPLSKAPAFVPAQQTYFATQARITKINFGKYVLAGTPQKIKKIQPAAKEGAKQNIKYFGIDQGLSGTFVSAMLKDRYGRLWFGTNNGLSMYDGTSFYNYTVSEGLGSNFISCLAEDSEGRIWIGSKGAGLCIFNGKGFLQYTTNEGLCSNDITAIVNDKKNRMWIGTPEGINIFADNGLLTYTAANGLNHNSILCLREDEKGRMWIGTTRGINIFNGNGFIHFTGANEIEYKSVQCLFEDIEGMMWIGTSTGAFVYDGAGFTSLSKKEGLISNNVRAIAGNDKNDMWIATTEGVDRFDGEGFTRYTDLEGLSNTNVSSLLFDDQKQLWIGTLGGGANLIGDYGFLHFHSQEELNFSVQSLSQDRNGNIWIGTSRNGAIIFDGDNFRAFGPEEGLSSDEVTCLVEDNEGRKWIGSRTSGIDVYDGRKCFSYTTKHGLKDDHIQCMIKDKKNNIWIGTYNGGINVFNEKGFTYYDSFGGLSNDHINALYEDKKGNVWIGTFGGGVNVFNGKGFTQYTTAEGLSNNIITDFVEDNSGRMWIGTLGGGLCLFDGKGFTYFTTNDGLCDNNISSLVKDSLGRVWAGTGRGLNCFVPKGDSLFTVLNYKKRQGLCDLYFNKAALYDQKGKLWWGTGDVLTSYQAPATTDPSFPLTYVTEVDVMGKQMTWTTPYMNSDTLFLGSDTIRWPERDTFFLHDQLNADTNQFARSGIYYSGINKPYQLPENLSLPYDQNWVTFHFTGIRFKDIETLRYRYMLEGLENKLNPMTESNEADYRNLEPGKYTFKVFGRCRNAVWSVASEFSFEIRRPWWHTTVAYVAYLLIGFGSAFGIMRWRTSSLLKSKRKLENIVAERTAEIKKQNEELERLSIVASETDNIILIMDPAGRVEWVNSSFERICGISLNELKQLKGETIFEISQNKNIRQIIKECIREKRSASFEALHFSPDKKPVWLSSMLTPIFDENDNLKKLVIIDTDITERKNAEEWIRQKNTDITDSITYAKKIQEAILPKREEILALIPESFVLYKPRDIVSGDFYWFSETDNSLIIAVADCTGHGVPGAFMSMIGNSLLHKIVNDKKINDPGEILKILDEEIIKALKQKEAAENSDGMDIVVLEIDKINRTLRSSSANRPVYLIRNKKLWDVPGNKFPIGGYSSKDKTFKTHIESIQTGDTLYLFSDGYADQFGGKDQKKFKTRQLKETLLAIQHNSMEQQGELLDKTIKEWQGTNDQVDDILVVGLRFN